MKRLVVTEGDSVDDAALYLGGVKYQVSYCVKGGKWSTKTVKVKK